MGLYVGMDLHSTNCYTGIIDEEEKPQFSRKLPNHLMWGPARSAPNAPTPRVQTGKARSSLKPRSFQHWPPIKVRLRGWLLNRPTIGIGWWIP